MMSVTLSSDQFPEALRPETEMSNMESATLIDELGRRGRQSVGVDGCQVFKSSMSPGLIKTELSIPGRLPSVRVLDCSGPFMTASNLRLPGLPFRFQPAQKP